MNRLVFVTYLFLKIRAALATPSDILEPGFNANQSAPHHGYFVPPPNTRGTMSIIVASFSTLFTCVWTAVHLNIPSSNNGPIWKGINRICWLMYATFVPEYVLSCAVKQWLLSQDLRKEINRIGLQAAVGNQWIHQDSFGVVEDPCGSYIRSGPHPAPDIDLEIRPRKKHTFSEWDSTVSFFAASGGIAVDARSFSNLDLLTFTAPGLLKLAVAGVLPDLSTDEVKAMSKQDGIAKTIVCIQVTWFLVQSVARVIQGLPLTLVELHVITHIVCALAMYVIWFKKPYQVTRPYFCKDERIVNLAALFFLHYPAATYSTSSLDCRCKVQTSDVSTESVQAVNGNAEKCQEHLWRANEAVRYLRRHGSHFEWWKVTGGRDRGAVYFRDKYVTRAIQDHKSLGFFDNADSDVGEWRWIQRSRLMWVALVATSLMYSAGYALAWNFHFPSNVEKQLWRSSVITLLVGPFSTLMFFGDWPWKKPDPDKPKVYSATGVNEKPRGWRARSVKMCEATALYLGVTLAACCAALFPFARLYVLVECFASLREPAAGTYKTVNWTNWLGHFG